MVSHAEMMKKVRAKMKGNKKSFRDDFEWRPPQAKPGEDLKFKFTILPPFQKGEQLIDGEAKHSMDYWCTEVGAHWLNTRPYECPRVHDGVECPICTLGFKLLAENPDNKQKRSDIAKAYLPNTRYVCNIYFAENNTTVDEDLRGKVMWYAMPKSVLDICEAVLMREDDGGDPDSPEAYGPFFLTGVEEFEEMTNPGGYVFQLRITHQGSWNSYSTSSFLPNSLGPLVRKSDGTADKDAIDKILASRHDIFSKFAPRDVEALRTLAQSIEGTDEPTQRFDDVDTTPVVDTEKSEKSEPKTIAVDDDEVQNLLDQLSG